MRWGYPHRFSLEGGIMSRKKARNLFIFSCLAPATLLILTFIFYPTFQVFKTSLFKKTSFVAPEEFAGFFNYKILFTDMKFIESLQNTILYIVLITIITLALAILFATLLMREDFKGKSLFRIIFYIPNILSMVVVVGIFGAIYAPQGLLNSIFGKLGLTALQQQWLGNPDVVNYAIIVALIWQAIGYYMVMYMSSMATIPEHLYEAAGLEGATKVKQFFMITLPLIWNNIRTTLTFFIISTINLSFMFVDLTTDGNLGSEVTLNYMYGKANSMQYAYGMAIGVSIFLFSFALSAIINKITQRDTYQY